MLLVFPSGAVSNNRLPWESLNMVVKKLLYYWNQAQNIGSMRGEMSSENPLVLVPQDKQALLASQLSMIVRNFKHSHSKTNTDILLRCRNHINYWDRQISILEAHVLFITAIPPNPSPSAHLLCCAVRGLLVEKCEEHWESLMGSPCSWGIRNLEKLCVLPKHAWQSWDQNVPSVAYPRALPAYKGMSQRKAEGKKYF